MNAKGEKRGREVRERSEGEKTKVRERKSEGRGVRERGKGGRGEEKVEEDGDDVTRPSPGGPCSQGLS